MSKEKINELLDEAISEDGETVNFQAMHELLEASINQKTSENEPTIDGANEENGANDGESTPEARSPSERVPTIESDIEDEHDTEPEVKKIDPSLVGWTTKSNCCEEFNRKLFGSQTETSEIIRSSDVHKTKQTLPKGRDTLTATVDTISDKVDDFVNDTSKEVAKIDNRVKDLEESPVKKVDWTEDI